jgi:hypothetical protein
MGFAETTSEQTYQEVILSLIFPTMNNELYKIFGPGEEYDCPSIVKMKKLYKGTYVYEVTLQIIAYKTNQKPPYTLVTMTFNNTSGEYNLVSLKKASIMTKKIEPCRLPQ